MFPGFALGLGLFLVASTIEDYSAKKDDHHH